MNACQAGETLTCTTSSWPDSSFVWLDNLRGGVEVKSGPTYTLPAGPYDLTCVAYMYANCTNGYYSPVPFPDGVKTEGFPFDGLLSRTNSNTTMDCSENATVAGYAIGECDLFLRQACQWFVAWHSGRTSVSGRRIFPVTRSTCS